MMNRKKAKDDRPGTIKLPRPFSFHFGKGEIIEEVRAVSPYHEPTFQLLRFEQGHHAIRFCVYRRGMFQRMPLIVGEEEIQELGSKLRKAPKLKALLKKLLQDGKA